MKYDFIKNVIEQFKLSYFKTNDDIEKQKIKAMLNQCLRICDNYLYINLASKKAIEEAQKLNINLSKMHWQNQSKFDPTRKVFIFEHKTPIKMIIDRILLNDSDINNILESIEIAWITKEENDILDKKGYKSNRPDPNLAYKEAGIILLPITN